MKSLFVVGALSIALAATPSLGATASAAAAAPRSDAAPRLSNFADVVFDGIVGENAPELGIDFTPGMTLGALPLAFEKTQLTDIAALHGGQLHSQGDAGSAVTWLCYTAHARTRADTPETVWFTSPGDLVGKGNTLGMVVVEQVDASKASGCATAPRGFAFPRFSVPAIGATLGDLKSRFGTADRDRQGNVYYNSTRALNDGSGMSVYQTLGYVMGRKGRTLGLALTQLTTK